MGSFIELNDTLQITSEQGFPPELNLETHLQTPYKIKDFQDKIFSFHDKDGIRVFHIPPTRVFFVENRDGKWIYWGQILMQEINYDYEKKVTSGKYKIIKLFSPEEMREAFNAVDSRDAYDYFK